jgi:hypothetical protein
VGRTLHKPFLCAGWVGANKLLTAIFICFLFVFVNAKAFRGIATPLIALGIVAKILFCFKKDCSGKPDP